jgi:hypothetical protein
MTVGGRLYQPQQLEPITREKDGFYWRTPNSHDSARGPMSLETALNGGHQISLVTQVRHPELWPTPCARDWKDSMSKEKAQGQFKKRESPSLALTIIKDNGGQLSPMWVEWLMGYPIGHTELNALATAWFRCKSGKRLKNSQG